MKEENLLVADEKGSLNVPQATSLPTLSNEQLQAFDNNTTKIYGLEPYLFPLLEGKFPDGRFRFLDLGGGNGSFTDAILDRFPDADGTVLDSSQMLLTRNVPRKNKHCKHFNLVNLSSLSDRYNVVFCNWVLHHVIAPGFGATRELQRSIVVHARHLLTSGGMFITVEELKNGNRDSDLPSFLIFHLTRSTLLAPLTRRLGANTGGIGVAFFGQRSFMRLLTSVFPAVEIVRAHRDKPPRLWRCALATESLQNAAIFCCHE